MPVVLGISKESVRYPGLKIVGKKSGAGRETFELVWPGKKLIVSKGDTVRFTEKGIVTLVSVGDFGMANPDLELLRVRHGSGSNVTPKIQLGNSSIKMEVGCAKAVVDLPPDVSITLGGGTVLNLERL